MTREEYIISKGYLTKEDVEKKTITIADIIAIIMSNIASIAKAFGVLLLLIVISMMTESVEILFVLTTLATSAWLYFNKKGFLQGILMPSSLFMTILVYSDIQYTLASTMAYLAYLFIVFALKNNQVKSIFIPLTYAYIYILLDFQFYDSILVVSIINFAILLAMIVFEKKLRLMKVIENYSLMMIQVLFMAFALNAYYEFNNISSIFGLTDSYNYIYAQNILYILLNFYILYKVKNLKVEGKIINILVAIISFKLPFISYSILLYNLGVCYRWKGLRAIAHSFMIASVFLLYYTFTTTFLVKSLITFILGVVMVTAYVIIKRRQG